MNHVALLADIHGNLPALQAVIADIRERGIARVANLGDCLSGPLWPQETAALLMQEKWATIAGNHERQLLTLVPGAMGATGRYKRGSGYIGIFCRGYAIANPACEYHVFSGLTAIFQDRYSQ